MSDEPVKKSFFARINEAKNNAGQDPVGNIYYRSKLAFDESPIVGCHVS